MIPFSTSLAQGYPKILLLDNDTIFAFSRTQGENIAKAYLTLDQVIELYDSAMADIDRYQILESTQQDYMVSLNNQIATKDDIIDNQERIRDMINRQLKREKFKSKSFIVIGTGLLIWAIIK